MGEYLNTEERALKFLLETQGYTIYEITFINDKFEIDGEYKDIEFKISTEQDYTLNDGQSFLNYVTQTIEEDLYKVQKLMSTMKEKKEFKIKQHSNEVLVDMFEEGMKEKKHVRVNSNIVGRKQGKSSTIIYLAQKYGLPIVVQDNQYKGLIKKEDRELKVYTMNSSVVGLNTEIVLVDELEGSSVDTLMRMGYIVIGIVR